jgi:phosphoglucomutase
LIIGQDGILSTPAASNVIRKRNATGGILLTASHNPGGPENDFGIKYNMSNGGPAPESVTEKIFSVAKSITEYHSIEIPTVSLSTVGTVQYGDLTIEIIDPISDYVLFLKEIFDFDAIKEFLSSNPSYTILFDAMHAVTGPYAVRLFVDEFQLKPSSVINCIPKPDFNGGHPDPNLTYAHELVELVEKNHISFGAASDGGGDRNMIIGKGTFVNPSDSVAGIPYFLSSDCSLCKCDSILSENWCKRSCS